MDNTLLNKINDLISEGEYLKVKANNLFGTKETNLDDSEYIRWQKLSVAVINKIGAEGKRLIEDIDNYLNIQFPYEDSVERVLGNLQAASDIYENEVEMSTTEKQEVFIVHGQDNELKTEVQLFLSRAGLNDVVLHECPDKGRTIIDKLIEESSNACFIIALLSPDDLLSDGSKRARQNVMLEIGYFLGKLGKTKMRLLKKADIEIPSDLQGILYTEHDSQGSWRIKLLKEMKSVGLNFNIDGVIDKF